MAATVDALMPLSLLEAIRRTDTPPPEAEAEYVGELWSKRLGVSDIVYAQIKRYVRAAKRDERLPLAEATAIARLIGRRSDAENVFREAGRYLAREVYGRVSPLVRWFVRALPAFLSRPLALRQAQRTAGRYYNGNVERVGGFLLLAVPESATLGTAPASTGCTYYEASFAELLARLVQTGGSVEHVRCAGRGEGICQWRAEWRTSR